ncbi:prepilin-type N-terminal cleavage/methylation domain-containing protein [Candidatus Poribacteria bacterium]|nr:prepilin-type N-terminal cleavage/methylation domain-containing protein [Candidatus Poribacteria bacterium]
MKNKKNNSAIRNPQSAFSEAGFTLIEVLIAGTILSIIIFIIYSTFSNTTNAIERNQLKIEFNQESRVIINRMEKEISSAFFSKENINIRFKGEKSSFQENDNDRLDFVSTLNPPKKDTRESELMEVGYYLKFGESNEYGTLVRRYSGQVDDAIDKGGYEEALGERVKSLGFRYFDGSEWQDTWDTNNKGQLPRLLKVIIIFQDISDPNVGYPISTVIAIPLGEMLK